MTLRIALAQIGCIPGDAEGNAARVVAACAEAVALGAEVVLTPAMALHGLCPGAASALEALARALAAWPALTVVVGHGLPTGAASTGAAMALSATVFVGGRVTARLHAGASGCIDLAGRCAAIVFADDFAALAAGIAAAPATESSVAILAPSLADAELLLTPAAWTALVDDFEEREDVAADVASRLRLPWLCANPVGGDDETRFDGRSFALDAFGIEQARLALARPALTVLELDRAGRADQHQFALRRGPVEPLLAPEARWQRLLIAAIAERVPGRAFIADDGGIGAAVLRVLCEQALGADRVVSMDTPGARPLHPVDRSELVCARPGLAAAWAPLRDIYRGEVIRLARWLAGEGAPIDLALAKSARASLRDRAGSPLPPCDIVDEILQLALDDDETERRILARGFDPADMARVLEAARRFRAEPPTAPIGPHWRRITRAPVKAG